MPKAKSDIKIPNEAQTAALMMAASPLYWTMQNKIQLREGLPFTLDGHYYQAEMLDANHRRVCHKKGAQLGYTEKEVLRTLHGMIYRKYPTGVLYLFPTGDDVGDFSKSRFNPLISVNPVLRANVKDTDSASVKKIGGAYLFLRGARSTARVGGVKESSSKLKSIPVDKVVFDECDEMSDAMIQLALERMAHSKVQEEVYLSTPTIPDFGIDAIYESSDQRVWMIYCHACKRETFLELEFPDCIELLPDGTGRRVCRHCKKEIFPRDGRWEAQFPSRAEGPNGMVGYWNSQLVSDYVDPGKILRMYLDPPNGNLAEVMNSKLGMAYIDAENRLSVADVYECCGKDPMRMAHDGPTAIGVDVGKELHCVVGVKRSKKSMEAVKVARLDTFNDLHDLAKAFHCRCMVIDKYPETHRVRDFQKSEPYPVWLCGYQDGKRVAPTVWDDNAKEIQGHRTELLDASHALVTERGRLVLPRRNREIETFANQLTNVAKVAEEDELTKAKFYKYKKVGSTGDHYRHALTYCYLATQKISAVSAIKSLYRWHRDREEPGRSWKTA